MTDEEDLTLIREAAAREGRPESEYFREAFHLAALRTRRWDEDWDIPRLDFGRPVTAEEIEPGRVGRRGGRRVIVVGDTSGLVAALNTAGPEHEAARTATGQAALTVVSPLVILDIEPHAVNDWLLAHERSGVRRPWTPLRTPQTGHSLGRRPAHPPVIAPKCIVGHSPSDRTKDGERACSGRH
jgi:hypothetical protein